MTRLGIGERLKGAIVHNKYKDLRYTGSYKFRMIDAIENIHLYLKQSSDHPEKFTEPLDAKAPINPKGQKKVVYTQTFEAIEEELSSGYQGKPSSDALTKLAPESLLCTFITHRRE